MPAHSFREALATWQPQQPANDNAPITAESFAGLAERRAFVQRVQAKPEPVLALPTLERLGRAAPDVVRLWKFWRDIQAAPSPHIYNQPEIVHDHATAGSLRTENGIEDDPETVNTGFSEGGRTRFGVPSNYCRDRTGDGGGGPRFGGLYGAKRRAQ